MKKFKEPKICEFTGKKYIGLRKVKCNCECHDPKNVILHIMPCCDEKGLVDEYIYIDE